MDRKVSVIVPVYNVEKYVDICLKSIIHQTYKNIEVIVVDDGSRDKSGVICDRFAEKDSRITVIHQENGGVSRARNNGIDHATGDYICFVDSDDWLPRDSVEVLVRKMEETGSDFVSGNKVHVSIRNQSRLAQNNFVVYGNKTELSKFILDLPGWGPVANLYKTAIIKNYSLYYPEDVRSREDTLFLFEYFGHCDKMLSVDKIVYYVSVMRNNSLTHSYFSDYDKWSLMVMEKLNNILTDCIKGLDNMYVDAALSISAEMSLNQVVKNYMFYRPSGENDKVNNFYNSIKKYIIWDYTDYPYNEHPQNNVQNRKIAETIRDYGVGDELYALQLLIGKNQLFMKMILRKIICPVKLMYYRLKV